MTNKKGFVLAGFMFIFLILNLQGVSAALGIRPALTNVDFTPRLNFVINFQVLEATPDQNLSVYAEGDLAEYVSFDKTNLTGNEAFSAYVSLPNEVENPGLNRLYIKVAEVQEETVGISTRLVIGALIKIKVPYPGKYAEIISFTVNHANEGEPVNFVFEVESLGNEEITAAANLEIYSDDKLVSNYPLGSKLIKNQSSEIFRKTIDKGFRPGIYNATVFVDYGKVINESRGFKIGTLLVDIINWSSEVEKGKINEFNIEIESKWNNGIRNIYAEVNVTSDGEEVEFFKTPSVFLEEWGKEKLIGFFNAENLKAGNYKAKITLFYEGETNEKIVDVKVIRKWVNKTLLIGTGAGIIILILITINIYLFFKVKKRR